MNQDLLEILEMVRDGAVTPEQGAGLIEALNPPTHSAPSAESPMPEFKNVGTFTLTPGFLSNLDDGTSYVNVGTTVIAAEVSAELLARKIARYRNVGRTVGPGHLIAVLASRCHLKNVGVFEETPPAGAQQPAAGEAR